MCRGCGGGHVRDADRGGVLPEAIATPPEDYWPLTINTSKGLFCQKSPQANNDVGLARPRGPCPCRQPTATHRVAAGHTAADQTLGPRARAGRGTGPPGPAGPMPGQRDPGIRAVHVAAAAIQPEAQAIPDRPLSRSPGAGGAPNPPGRAVPPLRQREPIRGGRGGHGRVRADRHAHPPTPAGDAEQDAGGLARLRRPSRRHVLPAHACADVEPELLELTLFKPPGDLSEEDDAAD